MSVRVRTQRALASALVLGVAALGTAALGLCLVKVGEAGAGRMVLWASSALPLAGALLGALRPVSPLLCARLLDRSLGSPDLVASAYAFSLLAGEQQTPFMRACAARAVEQCTRVRPAAALPLRLPKRSWLILPLGAAVTLLSLFHVPAPVATVALARPKVQLLSQEDLQGVSEQVQPWLTAAELDPAVREGASELNALLEAMKDGSVDRAEVLAALRELEGRLGDEALEREDAALRDALAELGGALDDSPMAKPLSEALKAADAGAARRELEALAESVEREPPKGEAKGSLRKALERSAAEKASAKERELAARRAELERLLKKKQESGQQDERQERLLQRKQRELEQLERDQAARQRAERELDQLRRELGEAGKSLGRSQPREASQPMKRGAQELERAEKKQLSAEQRQRLKERLQELRELVRRQQQQGGAGKEQKQSAGGKRLDLQQFGKAARGEGQPGKDGKPGGQDGDPKLLVPGGGQNPSALIELPETEAEGQGMMLRQAITTSPRAGEGGRPELAEEGTRLSSKTVDTQVQGESREGPTRSEVIREAGQHGFASRPYERVHAEYQRHAETVLERERVPGGYRYYVRRYFQLIRPREGGSP